MELFKQADSKESFSYLSNLLLSFLNEKKQKYSINYDSDTLFKEINEEKLQSFKLDTDNSKDDYLSISNDIHSVLSNCPDLTNDQKLDYCDSQRYFMKLYLKEVMIQINKS